jgi:hypothetical protein
MVKSGYCNQCREIGVNKRASYGYLKDKKRTRCSKHKLKNMIDLVSRMCQICSEEGTIKVASFGYPKDKKKLRCSKHKLENMIHLVSIHFMCQICQEKGINKVASYGYLKDKKKLRCSKHKLKDMINLVSNMCQNCLEEEGIFRGASYGYPKDRKSTRCSKHKLENMINLVSNMCQNCSEEGINKRASYGYLKDRKKLRCSKHKLENMVNLASRMCQICSEKGIFRGASYGYPKDKKKLRCSKHKLENMIYLVRRMCQVCLEGGINKRAFYGYLFEKKIRCSSHKLKGMILNNNPKCEYNDCKKRPFFCDEKDDLPKRCDDHKNDNDVDIVRKQCTTCLDDHFIPSDKDQCRGCIGFFKRKTKRGLKEQKIANCLESISGIIGNPVRDEKVKNGCSNKRPDFYYKKFTDCFDLIVEVDENQHSRYTCGIRAELQRIINIYENDCGGFPLVIVRFNPDKYSYKGKTIKSYKGREHKLLGVIKGLKNRKKIENKINIIYLYYDEFNETEFKPLDYKIEKGMMIINHEHPHSDKKEHCYKLKTQPAQQ